jgi:glucose/arabinose dehydrogenase
VTLGRISNRMKSNEMFIRWDAARWRRALIALGLAAAVASCSSPTAVVVPTITPAPSPTPGATATVENQPIPGGPVLLRADMSLRKVVETGGGAAKLALNPADGKLYYLMPSDGVFRVDAGASPTPEHAVMSDALPGASEGLAFGQDGTMYVVSNESASHKTHATVRRGKPDGAGGYTWSVLAQTAPYPLAENNFDHLWNGITVSPDGKYVFVNAGSRTDHGEVEDAGLRFTDTRDVALTARIFRLPADATNLQLPNDEAALATLGVVYARGTRNAYDLAFAPNGDLFAIDNGPDADYPDELNWIRQGLNYGFPWRFGLADNPQQFPDYNPLNDKHLNNDFVAVQRGTYKMDPGFPKAPGAFTDPVINLGPAAAQYRADDGTQHDAAAEGKTLNTFTPHRSPLGLVFATDPKLPAGLRGDSNSLSVFLSSFGAAGGSLTDKGQDLLHLVLTKNGDNYQAVTTQIARGFQNPVAAVLIENRLYLLEFGAQGAIWEITFK